MVSTEPATKDTNYRICAVRGSTEHPATGDTEYRICTVRGINSTSTKRYRLQNLYREWYQQYQHQETQTTESAPATRDTDYSMCTVRGINRTTSNRRYRLQNLHRAWHQLNQQQMIQTTESAPCVASTEPATGDTDYRTSTVRGINRTSNRRYRLQNEHRVWYQQNNQQQEIQTTESAP